MDPIAPGDIVVWGTPVYAGRIPNKTLEFVEQHIAGHDNAAIALCTFGNRAPGQTLPEMLQILERGNMRPQACAAIVARHVFAPNHIAPDRPNTSDWQQIDQWTDSICLDAHQSLHIPTTQPLAYYQPLKTDGSPANFLKAKPKVDVLRCTHCGRCAALCPMGVIGMAADEPQVASPCIKCQACIQGCPSQAITFTDPDFRSHAEMLMQNFANPASNLFVTHDS